MYFFYITINLLEFCFSNRSQTHVFVVAHMAFDSNYVSRLVLFVFIYCFFIKYFIVRGLLSLLVLGPYTFLLLSIIFLNHGQHTSRVRTVKWLKIMR